MKIKIKNKGDFKNTETFFSKSLKITQIKDPETIANKCLDNLIAATPVDSGETARSWSYEIEKSNNKTTITFNNSNIQNGVNVALMLEYGHATPNGYFIEGKNFINKVIMKSYLDVLDETWEELKRL